MIYKTTQLNFSVTFMVNGTALPRLTISAIYLAFCRCDNLAPC